MGGAVTRHDDRVRDALEAWAATLLCDVSGLGWPSCTVLGRILEDGRVGASIRPSPGPRVPRVYFGGRYWLVERALAMAPECREVARAESGLLNGRVSPRAGIHERAKAIGLSRDTYKRRLDRLNERIGWELDWERERRALRASADVYEIPRI